MCINILCTAFHPPNSIGIGGNYKMHSKRFRFSIRNLVALRRFVLRKASPLRSSLRLDCNAFWPRLELRLKFVKLCSCSSIDATIPEFLRFFPVFQSPEDATVKLEGGISFVFFPFLYLLDVGLQCFLAKIRIEVEIRWALFLLLD
ncbi:hypothetical protein ACLOJK_029622 [Asimina triloba]